MQEQWQSDIGRKYEFYNLAVKQKAVCQPTLRHRHWLQQQKGRLADGQRSIRHIESNLPELHGIGASVRDYVGRLEDVEAQLDIFYNNVALKKHLWDARRALAEEYRQNTNNFLTIVGYIVAGVDEYCTSKKCPVCEEFVGHANLRRFYCPNRKYYMRRDVKATHNMCNVIRGHLLQQQRPLHLQPKDVNGNYPWLKQHVQSASNNLQQSASQAEQAEQAIAQGGTTKESKGIKRRAGHRDGGQRRVKRKAALLVVGSVDTGTYVAQMT
ncbi:hypothetical protein EDD11_006202 [Mortierella claussenii]|nr:hypothetical protein EDD11_006202 [Mortierella claussenii]